VEARHASHIRQMRRAAGSTVKPWITGKTSDIIPGLVEAVYDGEDNTNQANLDLVNLGGFPLSADAVSEAFDEPLSMTQVLAIVSPFIAP
jgi:hypothetical protein